MVSDADYNIYNADANNWIYDYNMEMHNRYSNIDFRNNEIYKFALH